ncbi:MAG TPA: purine-nucleoside phosphorylase [Gemmatimonadota bacterium]|nr:purine-nucleoside phosphorylase [Gemmatimonadota bacterium]
MAGNDGRPEAGEDRLRRIDEATERIRAHGEWRPELAIILGTGLGALIDDIAVEAALDYASLPHFPVSTVESHSGRLIFGTLEDRALVAMQGRFHYYEGYSLDEVTFPVRVMQRLGVRTLIVSNASGGMNPTYRRGDLMRIDDHINLIGDNPLRGPNLDALGPRFPDMSEPYDRALGALVDQVALEAGIRLHVGVYVAVAGPNLETRAEYRFLRTIGADVVGMSTVPEVIVARHGGMRVIGLSIVTDECFPETLEPVDVETIIRVAGEAEPRLTELIRRTVRQMSAMAENRP